MHISLLASGIYKKVASVTGSDQGEKIREREPYIPNCLSLVAHVTHVAHVLLPETGSVVNLGQLRLG